MAKKKENKSGAKAQEAGGEGRRGDLNRKNGEGDEKGRKPNRQNRPTDLGQVWICLLSRENKLGKEEKRRKKNGEEATRTMGRKG